MAGDATNLVLDGMADSTSDHKHQYALAAAPLVAYFCMLTFEQGRYDFLGIPRDFVELPSQRIAQLGASTVFLLMLLSAVVFFFYHLSSSKTKSVAYVARSFFYALFYVPLAYIATNNVWAVAIALVISLASPWLHANESKETRGATEGRKSAKELAQDVGGFLLLSIFFVSVFFGFGKISQRNNVTYNVLTNDHSKVVVGTYNERFIIKSFDPKTRKLEPGVSLVAGSERIDISTAQVGPLVP